MEIKKNVNYMIFNGYSYLLLKEPEDSDLVYFIQREGVKKEKLAYNSYASFSIYQ